MADEETTGALPQKGEAEGCTPDELSPGLSCVVLSRRRALKLVGAVVLGSSLSFLALPTESEARRRKKRKKKRTVTVTRTFSNFNKIEMPLNSQQTPLQASLYPSQITVSGFNGPVQDVNLTINNLTHPFPRDLDVLLVGPQGQNALVMSDVGGNSQPVGFTFTLDDEATNSLTFDGPLLPVAKPSNAATGDTFPAPAPAPSGGSTLSVFDGTNPNGTWQLFVVDDIPSGDPGAFEFGWRLQITATALVRR